MLTHTIKLDLQNEEKDITKLSKRMFWDERLIPPVGGSSTMVLEKREPRKRAGKQAEINDHT